MLELVAMTKRMPDRKVWLVYVPLLTWMLTEFTALFFMGNLFPEMINLLAFAVLVLVGIMFIPIAVFCIWYSRKIRKYDFVESEGVVELYVKKQKLCIKIDGKEYGALITYYPGLQRFGVGFAMWDTAMFAPDDSDRIREFLLDNKMNYFDYDEK